MLPCLEMLNMCRMFFSKVANELMNEQVLPKGFFCCWCPSQWVEAEGTFFTTVVYSGVRVISAIRVSACVWRQNGSGFLLLLMPIHNEGVDGGDIFQDVVYFGDRVVSPDSSICFRLEAKWIVFFLFLFLAPDSLLFAERSGYFVLPERIVAGRR
ncbi:hypothetical protein CEXT_25001 [Caerostris extrusa]|uniref:Uncharacterized protein n=1 Tax=Caerostris extrusa TaxID=172846 RepID=A0AAV4THF4_CAEEX|nr:hypothetical protein CEXT_25001 [Caerostris extrusa]